MLFQQGPFRRVMKQVQALFERLTIALSVHPRIVFCFMGMLICVAVYSLLLIKEVDGSNYRMHTQKVEITSDIWASEPITTHKFLAFTHENKAPYLSRPVLSTITYVLLHNLFDVVFDLASHWSTFMFHVSFASLSLTILLLHFYEKRHFVLYLCAYLTITTLVICSGNFFTFVDILFCLFAISLKNSKNGSGLALILPNRVR